MWLLWCLIVWVKLTGLRGAQKAGKHYFWMCLWGCFGERLASNAVDWIKRTIFTSVGGHRPIHWRPEYAWVKQEGGSRLHSFFLLELRHPSSALELVPGLSDSAWDLYHPPHPILPPVLRASDSDWATPPAFLVLQLADGRLWDLQAFVIGWACIYTY